MEDKLIAKIDAVEQTFINETHFSVTVQLIKGSRPIKYEVLLSNKDFKENASQRWMSSDFMVPLMTEDLNVALAEASTWARFLGTIVIKNID